MLAVIDTNVIVSALINPDGKPAQILNLIYAGEITTCYNAQIMLEYETVLKRAKFGFPEALVDAALMTIEDGGFSMPSIPSKPDDVEMSDESDRKFYDLAKTNNAFLITGNLKHFPEDSRIITPAEALALQ